MLRFIKTSISYLTGSVVVKITLLTLIPQLLANTFINLTNTYPGIVPQHTQVTQIEHLARKSFSPNETAILRQMKRSYPEVYKHLDWGNYQKQKGILSIPVKRDSKTTHRIVINPILSYLISYEDVDKCLILFKKENSKL